MAMGALHLLPGVICNLEYANKRKDCTIMTIVTGIHYDLYLHKLVQYSTKINSECLYCCQIVRAGTQAVSCPLLRRVEASLRLQCVATSFGTCQS